MRRYLIGIGVGWLLLCIGWWGLARWQIGAPTESSRWLSEAQTKKNHAAALVTGPRLLIVGGSSSHFGLRAEQLTKALGVPTINLGVSAGLDLPYILWNARRVARAGDTILLVLEYELYDYDGEMNVLQVDFMMAREPDFFFAQPLWAQLQQIFSLSPKRLKQGVRARLGKPNPPESRYDAQTINAFGDETANRKETAPKDHPDLHLVTQPLVRGFNLKRPAWVGLRDFLAWARTEQVRVFAGFPALLERPEYGNLNEIELRLRPLKQFYWGEQVETIGTGSEFIYERPWFYDTHYHLQAKAAELNTKALLKYLKPMMGVP
jgi:hypothetical protein